MKKLSKAKKLAINSGRLNDNREQFPVEWLLKNTWGAGYTSNLEMIKTSILCMDKNHQNYEQLSYEDKLKADELMFHEQIVDRVLVTTFQWFGTNIGKHDIGELLDKIRKLKYKDPKEK